MPRSAATPVVRVGRHLAVLALMLGAVILLVRLLLRSPDRGPEEPPRMATEPFPAPPPAAVARPTEDTAVPAWPPGALPRQAFWRIEDAEAERRLEAALAAGLRIRGRIAALGLVLLEGDPALLASAEASDLVGFNVPVALPPLPRDPLLTGSEPFGAGLLQALDVADRPADWGRGVRIALLDTGVAPHPAFDRARISQAGGGPGIDPHGHGTAVASLLVGDDRVARGLAPGADLLVYAVLDAHGRGDAFGLAAAIVDAVERGAQIISVSAGGSRDAAVLREAVAYAVERQVVIVAAAGNDGADALSYPAAYADVLAVGAVDAEGRPADFSNHGTELDLVAPGVGLYAATRDEHYTAFSGTSAAVPVVAGAIAAVASREPYLTPPQAAELLLGHASDLDAPGLDAATGAGLVDPYRVLQRSDPGYTDLGVSAPYLSRLDDGSLILAVNVQNRGNQYVPTAELTLRIADDAVRQNIEHLEAGTSLAASIELAWEPTPESAGIDFEATVRPQSQQVDDRPGNDSYVTQLFLPDLIPSPEP